MLRNDDQNDMDLALPLISDLIEDFFSEEKKARALIIKEESESVTAENLGLHSIEAEERKLTAIPVTYSLDYLEQYENIFRDLIGNIEDSEFYNIACSSESAMQTLHSNFKRKFVADDLDSSASFIASGTFSSMILQNFRESQLFSANNHYEAILSILVTMKSVFMKELVELHSQLDRARLEKTLMHPLDMGTQTDSDPFDDEISRSDFGLPSSSRASSIFSRENHTSPVPVTLHSDWSSTSSSYKIFAYLGEEAIIKPVNLVTINFPPETELTAESLKQMRESSLLVKSPAGHFYRLSEGHNGQEPRAELTEEQAKPDPAESLEQSNLRLAQTIMNMIDNVLSRTDVIDVKTSNPFVAMIAHEYLEFIKAHKSGVIISSSIHCLGKDASLEGTAKNVFKDIQPQLETTQFIENNPALHYRPLFNQRRLSEKEHEVENEAIEYHKSNCN